MVWCGLRNCYSKGEKVKDTLAQAFNALEIEADKSTVPRALFWDLTAKFAELYAAVGCRLPDSNAWSMGKLKEAADANQRAASIGTRYGLSESLTLALKLAGFTADMGRLIIALQRRLDEAELFSEDLSPEINTLLSFVKTRVGQKLDQPIHGRVSEAVLVYLLGKLGHEDADPLIRAVGMAIYYHSDQKTPSEEVFKGNQLAFLLCGFVRDLDKLNLWVAKAIPYVKDKAEINRQIQPDVNNLTLEGRVPESLILAVENRQTIDRKTCETYVGLMVQFLQWRVDFNHPILWNQIQELGHPDTVKEYIRDRLIEGGNQAQWLRLKAAWDKQDALAMANC